MCSSDLGLKKYGGDLAIGAFGIVNRLVFIIVMIVMGLNQGMQPIAGYNFGAGQHARVIKTLKLTIIYATCVTTFGFIVGMLFSDWVVSIFTSDAELIALSAKGLRIVVMFFPIIGFQMVTANFFQSIGMASKAIFLSLTRQMMVLLPCLIILPRFFGVAGVWYSMPISDLLASLIAGTMLVWQLRKFKAHEAVIRAKAKVAAKPSEDSSEEQSVDEDSIRKELGIKKHIFGYSQAELERKANGEKVFPHVFGTDMYGRDILVRVMYGARVSMSVGVFAAILVLVIGALYGAISGYCGGKVDAVMQRIVELIYAVPEMLVVLLIATALKPILTDYVNSSGTSPMKSFVNVLGPNLISMFIAFGLLYWVTMSRIIRGQAAASRGFSRNQTKRRKRKQSSLSRPVWKAFSRFSCAVLRHHIEKKGNPIVLSLRHLLLLMRNLRSRGRRRFLSAGAYRASLRRCLLA